MNLTILFFPENICIASYLQWEKQTITITIPLFNYIWGWFDMVWFSLLWLATYILFFQNIQSSFQ